MTDEQMQDLRDFLSTTIRNEVNGAVREAVQEEISGFREEVNQRFEEVNQRFSEVSQRFNEVNHQFEEAAEVQNQILNAVGERFDDHEARITKLESKGGGKLKLRPAA